MSNDKKIKVEITADASGVASGMQQGARDIKEGTDRIQDGFESMQASIEKCMAPLVAFLAILKGGELLGDAVSEINNLTISIYKMSATLGVSAVDAGALKMALADIGVSSDQYIQMSMKLDRQAKSNADNMKIWGLEVRDAHGHLKDGLTLMTDAIDALQEYKAGTDRDEAAMAFFGGRIGSFTELLRLHAAAVQEAKERQHDLGLEMGPEAQERTFAYQEAMAHVSEKTDALKNAISERLLPALTKLGNWFSSTGPQDVDKFSASLDSTIKFFKWLSEALYGIYLLLDMVAAAAWLVVDGFYHITSFNLKAAGDDWQLFRDRITQYWRELRGLPPLNPPVPEKKDASKVHFDSLDIKEAPDLKTFEQMDAILAKEKLTFQERQTAHGQFLEFSAQQEIAYWEKTLKGTAMLAADRIKIEKTVADLKTKVQKEAFADEISDMKIQLMEAEKNGSERVRIAKEIADKIGAAHNKQGKEYKQALADVVNEERFAAEQIKKIHAEIISHQQALRNFDAEDRKAKAQADYNDGLISHSQLIQSDITFENEKYNIAAEALRAKRDLIDPTKDPEAYQAICDKILEIEREHQSKMIALSREAQTETLKPFIDGMKSLQQTWTNGLTALLRGQLSFSNAIKGLWTSITTEIVGQVAKMIVGAISQWIIGKLFHKVTALSQIMDNAGVAASAAYAATAAIPFVGPELAPEAAATAYAGAASYGASLSAEGGYDIPSGINPVAQLHQKEMVLPAKQADVIRGLADGQGGGQGGPIINIHALDAQSVRRLFLDHGSELVAALKGQNRNFAMAGIK